MMTLFWIAAAFAALLATGWVMRFAGQTATGNKPAFRDMSLAVAFGYVLGVAVIVFAVWYYFQPAVTEQGMAVAGVLFFRWAVQGFAIFAVAAWIFRFLGRMVGSAGTKKLFRQMPLTAAFGLLVILIYAVLAIFAGAIAPYGQAEVFDQVNALPGGNAATGGNPAHLLGTDQIGRDLLSRLIYGAQNTVGIAFATTCIAFFLGGTFGFLAAVAQGWFDQILSRSVDVLMAIPSLIFALLLMTIASAWAGSEKWLLTVYMVLIIAVIDSTRVFRLARAVGMNIVVMDYIEAAKLRGEGLPYLIFREILPNAMAPLLAEFGLRFCFVFLTIASLSFLGVGIQPPLADWGTMVRDLAQFINFAAFSPLTAALPLMAAGAIALLTVAVNFVVDWMLHRSSGLKE
ncbi:dipeptide transport system permease protein DppC [Antarctobacter heliothermus]|uniref:Dipeptide transport system permease protein DppC n=1 Tax=Antarctobacter heliothermus TaxID=74033 RepID=A0A222E0N4_9RHOB|nr:dipeptide transport system permease protein DppC [Antarctobacter heliothermus]